MNEIAIHTATKTLKTETFLFPGGEVNVRLQRDSTPFSGPIIVEARLQSPLDLTRLIVAQELIDRLHKDGRRVLSVPYFPYARQDRVTQTAEAFSLKPIAAVINSLGYDEVMICDPHSDVTPALIHNVTVSSQLDLVAKHKDFVELITGSAEPLIIVAPDAGAAKKAFLVAQHFDCRLVTATKVRNVHTGDITGTTVSDPSAVNGRSAVIVDDICDGGRTFIELARVLRSAGASKVYLYITHGIFSKGLGVFDGLIDAVYTTDTFRSAAAHHPNVPLFISNVTAEIKNDH